MSVLLHHFPVHLIPPRYLSPTQVTFLFRKYPYTLFILYPPPSTIIISTFVLYFTVLFYIRFLPLPTFVRHTPVSSIHLALCFFVDLHGRAVG